jgi:tRNA-splicing ligase RtcB
MKEDETLKQAMNMAMLDGVIKNIVVCSDAHQGYGACIGGILPMDASKGIISPGTCGYDINCLTGDSKILTEFGTYKEIKDFKDYFVEVNCNDQVLLRSQLQLVSLNLNNKILENKKMFAFMESLNYVYEIETESGLKIRATSDHPFLTKNGMRILGKFRRDESVAMNFFQGIEENEIIDEKKAIIAKIFGYILGDGTLYKIGNRLETVAYGEKEDLELMQSDLLRIGYSSNIYFRGIRESSIKTIYGAKKIIGASHELRISGKFAMLLKELGMPIGKKTDVEFLLPEWIKNAPKYIKRLFLAGYFGADMSTSKVQTKTGFYVPILGQNKKIELKQNIRNFMLELTQLLEEFDVKVTKISEVNYSDVVTVRLILSCEENNLLNLWRKIGFEYNKKRSLMGNISVGYILKKKKVTSKRADMILKIKEFRRKGFKLKEILEIMKVDYINDRFVERHYYENVPCRIPLNFISFENYKIKCLREIEEYGCVFDKVISVKPIGIKEVYDFNIEDNHNFIANGFIVSNCGVRMLTTNLKKEDVMKKQKQIVEQMYKDIPTGVGKGSVVKISKQDVKEILENGANWALKNGYGIKEDLEKTEDYGCIEGANANDVSERAIARGLPQLGSLGSGNHFLEVQEVEEIYDKEIAKKFGINEVGQVTMMIHCGSRGLGHQVASDYIKLMEDKYGWENLPDRELINAPIDSELGKKYFSAMAAAANFAFCNRQMIMEWVRQSFRIVYGDDVKLDMVYDVTHNIIKFEEHVVDGKKMKLCVHRKGATRAFGPGRKELPKIYQETGQPVIIPGSMGTASYLLVGTKKAEELSFSSTAHGAGRVSSRHAALKQLRGEDVQKNLLKKGIEVKAGSWKAIAEEAPEVYKNVDDVVKVCDDVGIAKLVVKLKPLGVIKG